MKKFTLLLSFFFVAVLISYGQWSTTYLSQGTIRMGGTVLENKAYFAGGLIWGGSDWFDTDKVEIYDHETGLWKTPMEYLSQARQAVNSATCGGFVFFAGGLSNGIPSSKVDIFINLGPWGEAELSVPRFALSTANNDSLVLFAGGGSFGEVYDVVDIYNVNTHQWSVTSLSIPRTSMGSAVIGNLAFFAGGGNADNTEVYDRIDIYNFITGTWDTASLSQARSFIGAAVAKNKVIFAGGSISDGVPSDRVDIFDVETNTWDTASLSVARGFYNQSATVCGLAYFVGNGTFNQGWDNGTDTIDVYDPVANTWSIMTLPYKVTENAVVAIDSTLFSAGGFYENNPPYGMALNTVEMYKDPVCGYGVNVSAPSVEHQYVDILVYPNPSPGNIYIELPGRTSWEPLLANLYNMHGQVVFSRQLTNTDLDLSLKLTPGIYMLKIISENGAYARLLVIQ